MELHVDGHVIPLLTDADIAEEDRDAYDVVVEVETDEEGRIEARLPASEEKAIAIEVGGELGDYTLIRPPGGDIPMSLSSLRPFRAAGGDYAKEDALHQVRLFHAVGSVAVAGGHVEMAMKKVLVTLRGGQNADLESVPADWNGLQVKLEELSREPQTELESAVATIFSTDDVTALRDRRNDVIHGYWWLVPLGAGQLNMSRYFRPKPKQAPTNIRGTTAALQKVAKQMFDLAARLEALVTPHWPLAIVPRMGVIRSESGAVTLRERLDDPTIKSTDLRVSKATKPRPGQKPDPKRKRPRRN